MLKKAQAAMEFLMTYGWAILVVLAAIAALAYFGVLSPDRFLPEKCTLPSGVACLDFTYDTTNGITVVIQNSAGFDMQNVIVSINGTNCQDEEATDYGTGNNATLTDGEQAEMHISSGTCNQLFSGKFKGELRIKYDNAQTGLTHTKVGELIMKID
jgi:hypothetical protein